MCQKFVKLFYVSFCIFGVSTQKRWDFSNSWSNFNNGVSSNNGKPLVTVTNNTFLGLNNYAQSGDSNKRIIGNNKQLNGGYKSVISSDSNASWNSRKPGSSKNENSGRWQTNEKKLASITNLPSSSSWNSNSNNIFSTSEKDNNFASSIWQNNNMKAPLSQNVESENWKSNNFNNDIKPSENDIFSESNYNHNSINSVWNSNNNNNFERPFNSNSGSNNWETTKNSGQNNNNNKKPQKPTEWNLSTSKSEKDQFINTDNQNRNKSSSVDLSILDELDKNDWYFGKESNYPKPPFRSAFNIDVNELWNFNKNIKSSQSSQENNRNTNKNKNNNGNKNNSNRRRENRQIKLLENNNNFQCECVNVNFCDDQDIVHTEENIKYYDGPLEEFACPDLKEVCCKNKKLSVSDRENYEKDNENLRCGQRKIIKFFDDIADNVAEPGEFPWILKLINSEFNCAASLIHHKMALTAAHCVQNVLPRDLILQAGVWNTDDEPLQNRKVSKIISHPDYNKWNPRNDIALLVLETPFKLNHNVNPVCLPTTNDKWDPNTCVVVSWKNEVQDVLEKEVVNFLPQADCQNIMLATDLWRNYILHDSFVCGLVKNGRQSCIGDEGGFVVCASKKALNTYVQVGIVSKGINCDEFGRPGIFTNVLKFLDWINENYFELGIMDDIDIRSLNK